MSLRKRLLDGHAESVSKRVQRHNHPKGWEPRVTERSGLAEVVSEPREQTKDEAELLRGSGLDPDDWRIIDGTIETRRWQQKPGDEWLYYYKFKASCVKDYEDPEWDEACKRLMTHKPRRPKPRPVKHARVVCVADWQVGKGEGGGSSALVDRLANLIDQVVAMCKRDKPDALYIVNMGDLMERCFGNYPSQQFTTDLTEREQERFARRGLKSIIEAVAPHVPSIVVTGVPSNHGENRKAGKMVTTVGDNLDLRLLEQLEDVFGMAPAYDHVKFHIPNDELAVTLDICGTVVAFTHGHQFNKGSTVQQKALNWWTGRTMGRFPEGEADVMVSAHYHHFQAVSTFNRLWLQCPSLDGGSKWFEDQTGDHSMRGTLTFVVDEVGARSVEVISPPE